MSPNPIDRWDTIPQRLQESGEQLAPGVWWVEHPGVDASRSRAMLMDGDFQVVPVDGRSLTEVRAAQAAIASALRLPGSAATNLDGLVDALRDLDLWWPRTRRIVLLWSGADMLRDRDLAGFDQLVEILSQAHDDLWRSDRTGESDGAEHERVLETVLLPAAQAAPMDPTDPSIQ